MKYAAPIIGIIFTTLIIMHFLSLEGVQGLLFSMLAAKEDTIFAPGYSDSAFRTVRIGMSEAQVLGRLHVPLGEVWFYENDRPRLVVAFSGSRVDHISSEENNSSAFGIVMGMGKSDVEKRLGSPSEKTFVYSRSRGDKSYHVRVILFRGGRVTKRISEFYLD
jgi:hypothetical protein